MNNTNSNFLKSILENKKKLLELIIVAIVLGLGISFVSSGLFDYFKIEQKHLIFTLAGILLIFLSFLYFTYTLFGRSEYHKEIDGFFLIDRKQKNIVEIDNYDYSSEIYNLLNSACSEDLAIRKQWSNTKFGDIDSERNNLLEIIKEVSEYYLLEKLSTHLSVFFNNTSFDKRRLKNYERNHIPDILLSNRFLELFSKPMQQRAPFIDEEQDNSVTRFSRDDMNGKVIANYKNGATYKYFDLILPSESKLSREEDSIIIRNKRFRITIKTIVSGVNTYIPVEYLIFYLSLNEYKDIPAFITSFRLKVKFNRFSFFKSSSWEYYKWIDSFINELEKSVSEKFYFEEQIEWNKIYPIIKSIQSNK